jgi:crossover junction endodeoxyribonuclease RusA
MSSSGHPGQTGAETREPETVPAGQAAASSVADSGAQPRSWEVALPPGLELLSLNGREHWAARNRTFQSLKKAAWAMLLNARLPKLERVTVRVIYDPPDRRPRDPDNLSATVKPLVDAIVAAKILPDDTSEHVLWAHGEVSTEVRRPSRLRIIITEVLPAAEEVA